MRRFALLLLLAALATGALAGAAPAARDCLVGDPADHTLCTEHFVVHYFTDLNASGVPAKDYSTETNAGDFAAWAEQAYAAYRSWGYAAPLVGTDGYIDITVTDLSGPPAVESSWTWAGAGPGPSSGSFEIATPTELADFAAGNNVTLEQEEQQEIALNVFHMFELAVWTPTTLGDLWLDNGAATWAAFHSSPFAPPVSMGNPNIALDCSETIGADHRMCDPNLYDDGGFARWAFFDLLATKYGNDFLKGVFANDAAGQTSTTALANALSAKGTSLAAVYTDFVNRFMSGTIGPVTLAGLRPPSYVDVLTGTTAVTTAQTVAFVPANHLAARYITFERGDGDGSHACYAAQLTVNVSIPSGTSSQPYFYWDMPGSSPQALSVSGSTASITVPWDTCDWGPVRGWVSVPNASTDTDGAGFMVSYSTTVDTSTPATATPPPDPTSIWGSTVPVPTTDVAPTIDVFGPELLKVSPKSRVIRLIVDSSGVGGVNAALGSVALGSRALRAGNNDLRFTVPAKMLGTLRRTSSSASVLTLTPVSPAGAAGLAVTRHVAVTVAKPVKKPAVKKKPKKKK
ncbi:MAG: hypothetical protein ACRDL2_09500 [Gaiellaceae bacterium]